jgi:hypothetical protein
VIGETVGRARLTDMDSAAGLLALAVGYRHSVARHAGDDPPHLTERELAFVSDALMARPAR